MTAMLPLEPGGGRHRGGLAGALLLEQFGREEGEIDRLVGVEPRIADRVIAVVEIGVRNGARAAGAFGDVLSGHLEMYTAGIGALGGMHLEEVAYFLEDEIERPRLVAGGGGDG